MSEELNDYLNERLAVHIKVNSYPDLYNLLMDADYIGIRLKEDRVSIVPMEYLYPEYFIEQRFQ